MPTIGVPSPSVDDAAHDVFVIVLRRGGDFAGGSSLRTWIFGVAYNVARNYRRKALSQKAVALDEEEIALLTAGPEELVESRQRVRLLYDLLDSLSDEKRAVFVLAEMEEVAKTAPPLSPQTQTRVARGEALRLASRQEFDRPAAKARFAELLGQTANAGPAGA